MKAIVKHFLLLYELYHPAFYIHPLYFGGKSLQNRIKQYRRKYILKILKHCGSSADT